MLRFLLLAAVAASLLASVAAGVQPPLKPKDATPVLDSLEPMSRAFISKRAKHVYRLPSGVIADFSMLKKWSDAIAGAYTMKESGTFDSLGNRRVTSREPTLGNTEQLVAFNYFSGSYVRFFYKDEELIYTSSPESFGAAGRSGNWKESESLDMQVLRSFAFIDPPLNRKLNKPLGTVVRTSVPGVFKLTTKLHYAPHLGPYSSYQGPTVRPIVDWLYYCRIEPRHIRDDALVDGQYFVLPDESYAEQPSKQDPKRRWLSAIPPEPQVIDSEKVTLHKLVPADTLRMSAEELAVAALAKSISFVEWKWRKSGQREIVWEPTPVEIRVRQLGRKPAEPSPPAKPKP